MVWLVGAVVVVAAMAAASSTSALRTILYDEALLTLKAASADVEATTDEAFLANERRFVDADGWISEAWVSFVYGNAIYERLMQHVIEAVHEFSTRPIVVYVIASPHMRFDAAAFPRLIVRRLPTLANLHVWFSKLRVAVLSRVEYGAIVESDTLVYRGADRLFEICRQHTNDQYLMPIHQNPRQHGNKHSGDPLDYPNRSIPYMHAHLVWSFNNLLMLARLYARCAAKKFANDEEALNILLWERKATKILCMYDPFYTYAERLFLRQPLPDRVFGGERGGPIKDLDWVGAILVWFVHGCKDPRMAAQLLQHMRAYDGPLVVGDNSTLWNTTAEFVAARSKPLRCLY